MSSGQTRLGAPCVCICEPGEGSQRPIALHIHDEGERIDSELCNLDDHLFGMKNTLFPNASYVRTSHVSTGSSPSSWSSPAGLLMGEPPEVSSTQSGLSLFIFKDSILPIFLLSFSLRFMPSSLYLSHWLKYWKAKVNEKALCVSLWWH